MNIILCVGSVCLAMQAKQVVLRDVMGAFAMLFGWVTLSKFVLLWQTNSDDKEHTALRVDESGVKASQSTTQALLPWSEFGNLIEGEDYLFLTFRENESRFLIIPREAFLSFEHAATFVAIARRGLMKGHESPMATPPDSNPYRTPRET